MGWYQRVGERGREVGGGWVGHGDGQISYNRKQKYRATTNIG